MNEDIESLPWKNGDILVVKNWIIIYFGLVATQIMRNNYCHVIIYHALVNKENLAHVSLGKGPGIGYIEGYIERYNGLIRSDIRYATNTERDILFQALEDKSAMWDEEKLQLFHKNGEPYNDRTSVFR